MDVELPNGQIAEFPDDMPHDQVESVIKQHLAPKTITDADKAKSFEQIKQRYPRLPDFLIHALMPIAVNEAQKKLNPTMNEGTATGAFLRSYLRTPLEGAENVASLLGLPVDKQAQWPSFVAESESDKQHPFAEIGGGLAGLISPGSIGNTALRGIRSIPGWSNIVKNASGSLLRRAPVYATEGAALGAALSPEGERGEGALSGALLGAAGSTLPTVAKGFNALKTRINSLRNLDRLKQQGLISEDVYQKAIQDENALQSLTKRQGIGSDVNTMEADLPALRQQASQLNEAVSTIPFEDLTNRLPPATGEELVKSSEEALKTQEQKAAEAEENLSKHLNKGGAHDLPIAEKVVTEIEGKYNPETNRFEGGKKQDIGKLYNEVNTELKDNHVAIPRTSDLLETDKLIRDQFAKIKPYFGENEDLYEREIQKAIQEYESKTPMKHDLVPAQDVLSNYQTARHVANELKSKAYTVGKAGNKDLQANLLKESSELMDHANKLESLLEQSDLGPSVKKLKLANERWRKEITPLYDNPTYAMFKKRGLGPSDIIKSLRGKGSGQEIIRNIIKNDPELTKQALGQRYANNPSKIHDYNELSSEYLESLPEESRQLIEAHRQALENVGLHEARLETAKNSAENMKKEASRVKKSFEESQQQQRVRADKQQQLKDINEKITQLERSIPELKEKARVKTISLKQKMDIENKIAAAEKDIAKLKRLASGLAIAGVSTVIGALGMKQYNQ